MTSLAAQLAQALERGDAEIVPHAAGSPIDGLEVLAGALARELDELLPAADGELRDQAARARAELDVRPVRVDALLAASAAREALTTVR